MTLAELLAIADKGYPDGGISSCYHGMEWLGNGDTLRYSIFVELEETFDADESDEQQLDEAIRVMERYVREIGGVIGALDTALAGMLMKGATS